MIDRDAKWIGLFRAISSMLRPASLDAAFKRLASALDQLEAASDRLSKAGAEKRDLVDTLAVMQDDRSRLAHELDAALGRTTVLEHATDEIALRLDNVSGTIRALLATADEGHA